MFKMLFLFKIKVNLSFQDMKSTVSLQNIFELFHSVKVDYHRN